MPFGDKMQKQYERALNGEMKKYKATGEAESDTYSKQVGLRWFTGADSTGSLSPAK